MEAAGDLGPEVMAASPSGQDMVVRVWHPGLAARSRAARGHWGSPSPRHQASPWGQAETRLGHGPVDGPISVGHMAR